MNSAVSKQKIDQCFSRAAPHYDRAAHLQLDVGRRLIDYGHTQLNMLEDPQIIDIGCGNGRLTQALSCYSKKTIWALDRALGMLAYARQHTDFHFICGDMEQLPLIADSCDVLFSNFTAQWCQSLGSFMAEAQRILRPGGYLLFTSLGNQSLHELHTVWQRGGLPSPINSFHQIHSIENLLEAHAFHTFHCESQVHRIFYPSLRDVCLGLKSMGASHKINGAQTGLTGRRQWQRLTHYYESFREESGLPLSFEVIYTFARRAG